MTSGSTFAEAAVPEHLSPTKIAPAAESTASGAVMVNYITAQAGACTIFAIDPGPERSGWCLYATDGYGKQNVIDSGIDDNHELLRWVQHGQRANRIAIETMQANYANIGSSTINTLIWAGRFQQAWREPEEVMLLSRQLVKAHVCNGNVKATDSGVRMALIDRVGHPGTKKAPGPTYGVVSHAWAALAVAVTAAER